MINVINKLTKKNKPEMQGMTFKCTQEMHSKIKKISKKYNVSVTKLIIYILEDFMDDYKKNSDNKKFRLF